MVSTTGTSGAMPRVDLTITTVGSAGRQTGSQTDTVTDAGGRASDGVKSDRPAGHRADGDRRSVTLLVRTNCWFGGVDPLTCCEREVRGGGRGGVVTVNVTGTIPGWRLRRKWISHSYIPGREARG